MTWWFWVMLGAILVLLVLLRRQQQRLRRLRRYQARLALAPAHFPTRRRFRYHVPTIIMAHRGLARYVMENTGPAIELAAMSGVNGIELDVRFTRDGVPVLLHDRSLDRVALRRRHVRSLTWQRLAQTPVWPANRIMRVDTFLAEHAAAFQRIMLDLKDIDEHPDNVRRLIDCLKQLEAGSRVIVDSASRPVVDLLLAQGLCASLRLPHESVDRLREAGVQYVSLPHADARRLYERAGSWEGLHVTAICPTDPAEVMWHIERDAFAVITDAVEETLDAMAAKGYITALPDADPARQQLRTMP